MNMVGGYSGCNRRGIKCRMGVRMFVLQRTPLMSYL